jgi:cytochrome P450
MHQEMYFATIMFILFLAYITIIIFLSFIGRTKKQNYNLPPGPSLFSIMLNIFELAKKPQYSLAKFSKKHGPIMHIKLGQTSTIIISSPDIAQEVLQTHDRLFINRPIPEAVKVLGHDHFSLPFMGGSDLWRELRKLCKNHLFSKKTLDASNELRCKKLQQLLCDIDKSSLIGEVVDVEKAAFKTSLNFMSNTFFSMDFVNSAGEIDEYKDIVENLIIAIGTPNLVDFFPFLRMVDPQGIRRISTTYAEKLLQIIDSYISKRLELRGSENYVTNDDVLDTLLNISQEDGQKMDKTQIRHLFLVIILSISF